MRLAEAEAAAEGRLDRARALLAQYEDTITELSQDASALTAGAQSLREENSGLAASLDTARAEADHLQVSVASSVSKSEPSERGGRSKVRLPTTGLSRTRLRDKACYRRVLEVGWRLCRSPCRP